MLGIPGRNLLLLQQEVDILAVVASRAVSTSVRHIDINHRVLSAVLLMPRENSAILEQNHAVKGEMRELKSPNSMPTTEHSRFISGGPGFKSQFENRYPDKWLRFHLGSTEKFRNISHNRLELFSCACFVTRCSLNILRFNAIKFLGTDGLRG
jgi:hypothetical protein